MSQNNWISVKDSFPKQDKEILICENGKVMIGMFMESSGNTYRFFTTNFEQYICTVNVTHWMELPNPPEIDK